MARKIARASNRSARCLRSREARWTIRRLKEGWTLHMRETLEDRATLDMRFSLAGSRKAIEAACN